MAFGQGEGLRLPGQQRQAVRDRPRQHPRAGEAGQVEVSGEVLHELPHRDVPVAPQGHAVQVGAEDGPAKGVDQQLVVAQPPAGPLRQRPRSGSRSSHPASPRSGQANGLPDGLRVRRRLLRREQPLVRLRETRDHRVVGRTQPGLRLPGLVGIEVELLLVRQDRGPGEILAQRLVQVLVAHPVRGQEDQGVAVEPGCAAARFQDRPRRGLGRVARLPGAEVLGGEHHQPGVQVVGHVRAGAGERVDAVEVPARAQVRLQPILQLLRDVVRLAPQLLGAILGEPGDRGLRRVPHPRAVLVEVGGRRREPAQRIAEDRRRLARHDAAELDPPVVDAAVGRGGGRRGAEVDGARHPPRRGELAEVRRLGVDP